MPPNTLEVVLGTGYLTDVIRHIEEMQDRLLWLQKTGPKVKEG
jgi:hypothetical protein